MPQKIALFGGSFNPIHNGHLALAGLAVDYLGLNTVFFIPAADHPFEKSSLTTSFSHRLAMLACATSDNSKFDIYDGESRREGPSYAITTILAFKEQYPDAELFYIIGADNLEFFNKWHKYEQILEETTLLITSRPGYECTLPIYMEKYSTTLLPSPEWALSSSKVREYLSLQYSCTALIPQATINYIEQNKLYQ